VCKHWRALLLSEPSVWCRFHVDASSPASTYGFADGQVQQKLQAKHSLLGRVGSHMQSFDYKHVSRSRWLPEHFLDRRQPATLAELSLSCSFSAGGYMGALQALPQFHRLAALELHELPVGAPTHEQAMAALAATLVQLPALRCLRCTAWRPHLCGNGSDCRAGPHKARAGLHEAPAAAQHQAAYTLAAAAALGAVGQRLLAVPHTSSLPSTGALPL